MTWNEVLLWLILPAIGTVAICGSAIWFSRYIP
jgi:hypothetical protein